MPSCGPGGRHTVPDAVTPARRTPDPQDGGRRRTAGPIGIRAPRPTPRGAEVMPSCGPGGRHAGPDAANPARRTPDPQDGGRRRTAGPIGIRRRVRHTAGPRSCRRADPEGDTPIPDAANPARRTPIRRTADVDERPGRSASGARPTHRGAEVMPSCGPGGRHTDPGCREPGAPHARSAGRRPSTARGSVLARARANDDDDQHDHQHEHPATGEETDDQARRGTAVGGRADSTGAAVAPAALAHTEVSDPAEVLAPV